MLNIGIVRSGLAGLLLLSLGGPTPEVFADVSESAPSDLTRDSLVGLGFWG